MKEMKEMKKTLSLFLIFCLLLPSIALADTIREQVNAPAHITDAFYSNTGKTTVQIDADVTVPQTDRVPMYFIRPRLFAPRRDDTGSQHSLWQPGMDGFH